MESGLHFAPKIKNKNCEEGQEQASDRDGVPKAGTPSQTAFAIGAEIGETGAEGQDI